MPTTWVVHLSTVATRDLDHLPVRDRQKVLQRLTILERNPFSSPHIRKLKGKGVGQWQLEVWPYRVRYDVEGNDVIVYRVRHRKDIYKN